MSFSIQTNVASLLAQNNLAQSSQLQQSTIARVTSGLRITSSGVDAAGLAVANSYRSDDAVLTQGIQNANNGIAQLQIVDGGESNISQLLDRARSLATQSASGTFTGNRATLNNEFQSVLGEIDREAQSIGLNQGGSLATNLNVFIGGGKISTGGTAASAVTNGISNLNLARATVDTKSLGLTGVIVTGGTAGTTDIGTGSVHTSVQAIVTNAANITDATTQDGQAGYTQFLFNGPGFSSVSGSTQVKINVNLSGVTDTNSLVAAVNSAIGAAGTAGNQQATAFKNANIVASSVTDSTGKTQLTFTSSTSAFQATAGDATANALLGNFVNATTGAAGISASPTLSGALTSTPGGATTVQFRVQGAGLASPTTVAVSLAAADTTTALLAAKVQAAINGNVALAATGITVAANLAGTALQFTGKAGQTFEVGTTGDVANNLGLGSFFSTGASFDSNTFTAVGAAAVANATQGVQISVNSGTTVDLGVLTNVAGTENGGILALNTAIQSNSVLRAAGLSAVDNGAGNITLQAAGGVNFRINTYVGGGAPGDAFGFGAANAAITSAAINTSTGAVQSAYSVKTQLDAQGENQSNASTNSDVFSFKGLRTLGDAQSVTVAAVDAAGNTHSLNVSLTTANAGNLDSTVTTINTALQNSNDLTLQSLVGFKELNHAGTAEGVRFASANSTFSVSLGSTTNGVGLSDGGTQSATNLLNSAVNGTAGTVDISNQSSASAAVTSLAGAVTALGSAQAVVGLGENKFQYAATLAQSQLTNNQSAESQLRDANLAAESATLTKAQILLQAGVAALAQANSAPQQLLALLK